MQQFLELNAVKAAFFRLNFVNPLFFWLKAVKTAFLVKRRENRFFG